MITVSELIEELENIAPPELADEGDRIGLQVGKRDARVSRICVCLDASERVLEEAIGKRAEAIVAHHPLIYNPLKSVSEDEPVGARVARLIRAEVALYVMHTNLDIAPGGINDVLARKLGVTDCVPLTTRKRDKFFKIAVFVPEEAVDRVRDAMAAGGAGMIGQYTHCSFRTKGTGSFVPLPSARPYVGDIGRLEEVEEYRLEMVCAGSWLENVIAEMLDKHPYDEVAYDIYELANEPITYGLGRVGFIKEEMSLQDFADHVGTTLGAEHMKVHRNLNKPVRRVALCSGSGSSFFREAAAAGADVYVTGDTKYHDTLDAHSLGLAMIDAGHFETEKPGMIDLAERLGKALSGADLDIEYIE